MVGEPAKLKSVRDLSAKGIFLSLARVPQTETVIVGCSDALLYEYDLAAEKPEPVAYPEGSHASYVTGVAVAGPVVVSGAYDGKLVWWDRAERKAIRSVPAHEKWIRKVIASPDGRWIASVADDMQCKLWDAATGELLLTVSDHAKETPNHYPSMLYAVAFSPDGTRLSTGDKVGHVAVWSLPDGQKLTSLECPGMYTWDPKQRRHSIGGIRSLGFSTSGQLLAVGGVGHIGNIDHLDGAARVEVFEWATGERRHELADSKHKGLVEQILFSPDDAWFLTAGGDNAGFLTFYSTQEGKILHQDKAHQHVHAAALNESGDRVYTAHHGRVVSWSL